MSEEMKLPDNFIEKIQRLLPDEWEDFLKGYENGEYHGLRFNRLKTPEGAAFDERILGLYHIAAAEAAAEEPAETGRIPWTEDGFYYREVQARPGAGILHEAGAFYIQEPSAMGVVGILDPKPGDKVLDLCAAPGGKSTGTLSKLGGRGLLVANEIVPNRAKILSSNIERMGAANAIVTNESPDALEDRFAGFFDKIIVDAPCSGEGMFRKNPEALAEWSPDRVLACANRQRLILESADKMLATGGRLVYSTCTFSEEENEQTMLAFLEDHPEYREITSEVGSRYFAKTTPGYRLWPHRIRGEGHYICLLQKGNRGDEDCAEEGKRRQKSREKGQDRKNALNKSERRMILDLLGQLLAAEKQSVLRDGDSRLLRFGDEVYLLPEGAENVNLNGIHVLRPGLHLGTLKKDRFEPAHALAMSLNASDVRLSYDMAEDAAARYLKGEEISRNDDGITGAQTGWCLMTCMGYSLGWGKLTSERVKNHYPKGLRRQVYML